MKREVLTSQMKKKSLQVKSISIKKTEAFIVKKEQKLMELKLEKEILY